MLVGRNSAKTAPFTYTRDQIDTTPRLARQVSKGAPHAFPSREAKRMVRKMAQRPGSCCMRSYRKTWIPIFIGTCWHSTTLPSILSKQKSATLRKHLPRIVDICILGSCPGLIPAEIGQNWPKLAEIGRNWPKLAEIGRNWPKLAKIDRHSRVRHGPI